MKEFRPVRMIELGASTAAKMRFRHIALDRCSNKLARKVLENELLRCVQEFGNTGKRRANRRRRLWA